MKSKWWLILSILQLIIGLLTIISFVILAIGGENMTRWILTLLLAIWFVIAGIKGIVNYKSRR